MQVHVPEGSGAGPGAGASSAGGGLRLAPSLARDRHALAACSTDGGARPEPMHGDADNGAGGSLGLSGRAGVLTQPPVLPAAEGDGVHALHARLHGGSSDDSDSEGRTTQPGPGTHSPRVMHPPAASASPGASPGTGGKGS